MRCSNRKLLIVFEGSAQRERTIVADINKQVRNYVNGLAYMERRVYNSHIP